MKKKYSYQDMKRNLRRLGRSYPELLRVFRLAKTADNRWIYGVELGNPQAEKRVVIQASIHAREWFNTELIMKMLQRSSRQWKKNDIYQGISYRRLFENVCFFVIPMVNPDGVTISQSGVRGLRDKALRGRVLEAGGRKHRYWKANARGVDLNRNYSTGFAESTCKSAGSQEYAGKRPFSERETRALVKLIVKVRPDAVINYHSAGHLIYYREDSELVQLMRRQTGYRPCKETGEANGNLGDWLTEHNIDWCTIETCIGKAPAGRWQLWLEWRKHRDIFAAVAGLLYGTKR